MANYSHYVKGGVLLIDPTSRYKEQYILKCSECEQYFEHLDKLVSHSVGHYNDEKSDDVQPPPSDGNTSFVTNEIVKVKCENNSGTEEEEVFTIVKEEPRWDECCNDDVMVDNEVNKDIMDVATETISKNVETNGEIYKISEVKTVTPQASGSYSAIIQALGKLNKKMDMFADKFESFKYDIQNQNSLLVNVLGEHNIALQNALKIHNPLHTKQFPIKSLEDLMKLDESIDETNEKEYIATITAIIGRRGLKRGLADIVMPEVLVNFNVDGIHNKLRLLDLKKFINILFLGSYDNNSSQKSFKEDLKHALRLAKNRFFKGKTKEKKLNNETLNETIIAEIDEDIKLF